LSTRDTRNYMLELELTNNEGKLDFVLQLLIELSDETCRGTMYNGARTDSAVGCRSDTGTIA